MTSKRHFRDDFSETLPDSLSGSPPAQPSPRENPPRPFPSAVHPKKSLSLLTIALVLIVSGVCAFFFDSQSSPNIDSSSEQKAPPVEIQSPSPTNPKPSSSLADTVSPSVSSSSEADGNRETEGTSRLEEESDEKAAEDEVGNGEEIALTYQYTSPSGERIVVSVSAKQTGEYYAFYGSSGLPFTSAVYAGIGSPSQPELYIFNSPDNEAAGVIAGMRAANGETYYGVLSLDPLEWIIPCMYEDIYLEDGRYIGDIPMGSSRLLEVIPRPESEESFEEEKETGEEDTETEE